MASHSEVQGIRAVIERLGRRIGELEVERALANVAFEQEREAHQALQARLQELERDGQPPVQPPEAYRPRV